MGEGWAGLGLCVPMPAPRTVTNPVSPHGHRTGSEPPQRPAGKRKTGNSFLPAKRRKRKAQTGRKGGENPRRGLRKCPRRAKRAWQQRLITRKPSSTGKAPGAVPRGTSSSSSPRASGREEPARCPRNEQLRDSSPRIRLQPRVTGWGSLPVLCPLLPIPPPLAPPSSHPLFTKKKKGKKLKKKKRDRKYQLTTLNKSRTLFHTGKQTGSRKLERSPPPPHVHTPRWGPAASPSP